MDYSDAELDHSDNLFSKIVLAAKAMHQTKNEEHQRYLFKSKLMREIVQNQNHARTAVQATLHFIDYLLRLPENYMKRLSKEIGPIIREERVLMELYNKENTPPTILNSLAWELEKGIEQGIQQGIEKGIQQEKRDTAKKLLLEKIPLETISKVTGFTLEEVKEIQETIDS